MTENPIRALRAETGLTQSAFGAALNIPRRTLQSWEMGERECPAYVIDLIAYRIKHDMNFRKKGDKNASEAVHKMRKVVSDRQYVPGNV